MKHSTQGDVMAAAFSLVNARRIGLPEGEFGRMVAQVYNEQIDPSDHETSGLRQGLLLVHLARIAAEALNGWAEHAPEAVDAYTAKLVTLTTDMQLEP